MFALVFSRRFSMAHRLLGPDVGKCDMPHGHNEVVSAHMEAARPAALDGTHNMVAPFDVAKGDWHGWIDGHVDHALQLSATDPLLEYFRAHEPEKLPRLIITPGDPTTEVMAACFTAKLNAILLRADTGLVCRRLELTETPTNTVIFTGDPADVLPEAQGRDGGTPWWMRADTSTNDL